MPDHIVKSDENDHRSVLASVDSKGRRKGLLVAIIPGFWRRCRKIVAAFLILFYVAAPLVPINGMPMVRIDIPNRHYILFWSYFLAAGFFLFLTDVPDWGNQYRRFGVRSWARFLWLDLSP